MTALAHEVITADC